MTENRATQAGVIGDDGSAGKINFSGMLYWKVTEEETILVDPWHIRVLGFREQKDTAGNKSYVVYADLGASAVMSFVRQDKQEALDWFRVCQEAKAKH